VPGVEVGTSRWDVPVRPKPDGRGLCVQERGSLGGLRDIWPRSVRLAPDADVPAGRPYLAVADGRDGNGSWAGLGFWVDAGGVDRLGLRCQEGWRSVMIGK